MAHFGEILADLRRDKGLQQKELGKELHIAGSTISSYERGINLPNADRIIQIAICAAAHNTAYNYNRAKKKNYFIDIDPDNEPSPSSLEDSIIHREDLASLALVWNHLDEKTQYLLSARYILKKSGKEMAAELGIPADNVRMAVVRAKRKAKRAMEEYTETENH